MLFHRREFLASVAAAVAASNPAWSAQKSKDSDPRPVVPTRPAPAASSLSVHGREIREGREPVVLRGVNVGDPWSARRERPVSDFQWIADDWKSNAVRIGIHPGTWLAQSRKDVRRVLTRDVTSARKAGLYVILEWHAIGFPDGYTQESKFDKHAYDSRFALCRDFWESMSEEFGRDAGVLFELWNEPVSQKEDWRPEVGSKWTELKPYWLELIKLIRRRSTNVVIAASNQWSYHIREIPNDRILEENVAYSWHVYAGHGQDNPDEWRRMLNDLDAVAPVLATEWGFERGSKEHYGGTPETFGRLWVSEILDKRQMHNLAWIWHDEWGPAMLESDWRTPTEFGRFVRSYLRRTARA
jgi:hypothetical protein